MGSNQPLTVAATTTGQEAEDTLDGQIAPLYWNMLTRAPDVVGAGVWGRIVGPNLYSGYFYNTSNNDGDNFTVNFRCMAGTWTLRFNAHQNSDLAIVDVDMDTVEIGSFDNYAAAPSGLTIREIAGLALTGAEHALRFRVDGRNAASVGWLFYTHGIYLQRTA